jgi:hypothetical protein
LNGHAFDVSGILRLSPVRRAVTANTATWVLHLAEHERAALLGLFETTVSDIHVERRRTEAPAMHDAVVQRERILEWRALLS